MIDFIISVFISFVVNTKLVPYLDMIRNCYTQNGYDFTCQYYALLAISHLGVGLFTYVIIQAIKFLVEKIDS